jgi:hypothetical protein
MKAVIKIKGDGSGSISAAGASDKFKRVGADASEQIGWKRGKKLRVEVEDAERWAVHGGRLDYD